MNLQTKNSNLLTHSSAPAERIEDIISNEEKLYLDLLSEMMFQDILNQVKSHSNEK